MSGFVKATKKQAKGRVLLEAVSGGGKTWTGLHTALAMAEGGRVAVIDSEHGSAALYGDLFDFDVMEIAAPYTPQKYIDAIRLAENEGYAVALLDSLSHSWAGSGGVLQMVDDAKVRFHGNTAMAWSVGTPAWQALIDAMLQSRMHIIATLRSKSKMIEETDDRGKVKGYKKAGTEPVARDGIEFEFTISAELDREHNMVVGKSRCPLLPPGTVLRQPKGDLGESLLEWLNSGEAYVAPVDTAALAQELMETAGDKAALVAAMQKAKITSPDLADEATLAKARKLAEKIKADAAAPVELVPVPETPVTLEGEAA